MKFILRYRYFGLLIFPIVIIFLSWSESDTRFSRDLHSFFPKAKLSKKERVLYFLSIEEKNSKMSQRQSKELVRAIVRSSQRLTLPDETSFGDFKPDVDLFLYAWAKARTNFIEDSKLGYGILALPELKIQELEKKVNANIDRKFDIFSYNMQFKIAIILFKEYISEGKSPKEAYQTLYSQNSKSLEWEKLEKIYIELHQKVIANTL